MDNSNRIMLIFVQVGGFDGSIGLETAEFLDIRSSEKWEPIASMSTRRSSVGVGVLDGLLFAVCLNLVFLTLIFLYMN